MEVSMEASQEIYDRLIGVVEERIPEVATQVREEIDLGRPVSALKLQGADWVNFQQVSEMGLGRITKTDIAMQPYSSDEQLLILLEALQTLVKSMEYSRHAVVGIASRYADEGASVSFSDPLRGQVSHAEVTSLSEEAEYLSGAGQEIANILAVAREG